MFGLTPSSTEGRFSALFHIGSASISVALWRIQKNETEMLWCKRLEYGYQSTDDYNRYVRTMYATLLEAGMKLTSEGLQEVKSVFPEFSIKNLEVRCVLGSPWFLASVYTEVVSKEKPFQITSALLDSLKQSAFSNTLKKQECKSWQELMGTPELLEMYLDVVTLEGYEVNTYENMIVKELSVQMYLSIVSASVQEHVSDVIERIFPNHTIVFFTSTRILSNIKKYHLTSKTNTHRSVLLEVSGEITSVAFLHKGILKNIATVPFGTNHVLKALSPNAVNAHEARSALSITTKKNKEMDFALLPKVLQNALFEWHTNTISSIIKLSGGITPPTEFLLFVETPWQKFYKSVLATSWEMPGIRKSVDLDIQIIEEKTKKENTKNPDTLVVSIFANLLRHYTH
jgi:hypothetical protein